MGTSVLENDRIEEICSKVGRMRVAILADFQVTELKTFLKDTAGDGEKIPCSVIEQFKMLLTNRITRRNGTAWQIGSFLNHYEYNHWEDDNEIEPFSSLVDKVEYVFKYGDIEGHATLRGAIEMTYLNALVLDHSKRHTHPCFRAEEALKEKNRKDKERKKKTAKRKVVKKKATKKGGAR